jgi:hypothetical protein
VPANLEPVVSSLSSTWTESSASSYSKILLYIVPSIDSLENLFCINVVIKGIKRSICSSAIYYGIRRILCILFRFSSVFTSFIKPSRVLSYLCSVKALFSVSHHMCASFLPLDIHQMPQHSGCPLASLISGLFLSDLLE